ncbi:MAG: GNAT family acetyltransferase [Alphaproteobacteria bacterium BRH_c36]|nr:MAG: GNAT family acetyltransferase [Alphaproteobacteria bacterium BRH_c36]
MSLSIEAVTGKALKDVLTDLARLRIAVFRDWPYLYDGTEAYEREYLAKFIAARGAVCVVARDGDKIVGASTASPMAETDEEFIAPFEAAGYDIDKVFYCGESVLIGDYRGQGVGNRFFDEREAHARRLGGFEISTFCRVVRPDDHPLKPADYRPLDGFWKKRGYAPVEGLVAYYSWKDIGEDAETEKPLQFWTRKL